MIKKLLILPWFGPYPEWLDQWVANMERLKPMGYDYLIFSSKKLFEQRVKEELGLDIDLQIGTGKAWDFRPAFGVLFKKEILGYDFYGHTDFDCVYGDVSKYEPDLENLDVWSNHYCYCAGPWTLYRNCYKIKNLFKECPEWKSKMLDYMPSGWIEMEYSKYLDTQHESGRVRRLYTHFQGKDPDIDTNLIYVDGKLYDTGDEIMMFHFNRHKKYPLPRYEI